MWLESAAMLAQIFKTYTGVAGIVVLILQIAVIVSVIAGHGTTGHKVLWPLVILLLPLVGLILYVLFGRGPDDRPLLE